jgi:hypothetical protein
LAMLSAWELEVFRSFAGIIFRTTELGLGIGPPWDGSGPCVSASTSHPRLFVAQTKHKRVPFSFSFWTILIISRIYQEFTYPCAPVTARLFCSVMTPHWTEKGPNLQLMEAIIQKPFNYSTCF